jgi:hypothetical protein
MCQNLTFKVNFLSQKSSESFSLLKWCPIFDSSPLLQLLKFNTFLWVCQFLDKNLSNFVPPIWKLDNWYYHSQKEMIDRREEQKYLPTYSTAPKTRPELLWNQWYWQKFQYCGIPSIFLLYCYFSYCILSNQ